jgi:hypothetical protein
MGKIINMIGQKYAKLTVISQVGVNKSGEKMYECLCECGNKKSIKRRLLVRGHTKSCGCDWRLANKNHNGWRGYGDIPKDFFSNIRRGAESRNIEFEILKPLLEKTMRQLLTRNSLQKQTGPAKRNDKSTIIEHKKMLSGDTLEVYNVMTNSILKKFGYEL